MKKRGNGINSYKKDTFLFINQNNCILFNTLEDLGLVNQRKIGVLEKLIQSVNTSAAILLLFATGTRATGFPACIATGTSVAWAGSTGAAAGTSRT